MVQELFLLVPKKNGKSSYAAAIMVTAMIVNRRPNAEYLLIAPTKEIAGISYSQAEGIIEADPELLKLFHLRGHVKTIVHRKTGAELKIKAADTDVITGSKSTGILIDETHVFATRSNAADIFVEIRGALAARPDGFLIQITTQSKTPPSGVFKSELTIAREVRDGLLDLPRLAVLYELPKAEQAKNGWQRPEVWGRVNPNLGRSVDIQFLHNALTAAERTGVEQLALLASQHFNVQVGLALMTDRWAGADYWLAATDPNLTGLDDLMKRSDVAVVGIDGGGLDDLLGLAILGRDRETDDWLLWSHAWAHPAVLERRKEIVPLLEQLADEGDLTICQAPTQDLEDVANLVERVAKAGLLPPAAGVGLDPQGVSALVDALAARGVGGDQVVAVPQGYRLSAAIWGAERKLADGTLRHCGQGLMAWAVGNAKVEQRGNAILITKQAAGKAKIDPLMAAFNAVILMSRNPQAQRAPEIHFL
jgi:phage terminase large subunit-like protein